MFFRRLSTLAISTMIAAAAFSSAPASDNCEQVRAKSGVLAYLNCTKKSSRSNLGNSAQCNQSEATINIDWVFVDVGATRSFQKFYNNGNSALDSVIKAQAHNPDAQMTIKNCSGWAAEYIAKRYGFNAKGLVSSNPIYPLHCSGKAKGACGGCEITCNPGFEASCRDGVDTGGSVPFCSIQSSCNCIAR